MIDTAKWDLRFFQLAEHVAEWSKDPSTKVGAVLVGTTKNKVAFGYNGFPPGIADDERLEDRPTKYKLIVHAERNAIYNADFDPRGGTLYVTYPPCTECAKTIISVGIKRVVSTYIDGTKAWADDQLAAYEMMNEAGVELDYA